MNGQTPQIRLIYFTGIITAIDKQIRRLECDMNSAEYELARAKEEIKAAGGCRPQTEQQN